MFYDEKDIFFCVLVLEFLCFFIEPFNFSFFSISGWGIDADYCDFEWFTLEMNKDHSVILRLHQVLYFGLFC